MARRSSRRTKPALDPLGRPVRVRHDPTNIEALQHSFDQRQQRAAIWVQAAEAGAAPDAGLDYWPILRQDTAALVVEIAAGRHDPYLPQLEKMEVGHDGRASVVEACQQRSQALVADQHPAGSTSSGP